eukprot:g1533.t1
MRAEETVVAIPYAVKPRGDDVVDDTAWLLSVASLDEKALALQTHTAARDAAADAISRCAAIIKDTDAHVYRRGIAVLALGRTLGRELGNPRAGKSAWVQEFRKECGGPGGVLDSVLDVVGQCTPSPPTKAGEQGKAPAVLAGCGASDAHTIRTNCCALISLLASAVLATAPVTTTLGGGAENVGVVASAGGENVSPETFASGGDACNTGEEVAGGGGWDTFVPMGAKPNPDVVCLVRKKGWAARQQQEQQQLQRAGQSTEAGTAARDLIRSLVPGTYGQAKKRRRPQKLRVGGSNDSRGSPVRRAAAGGASRRSGSEIVAAGSPGKRWNEQHHARTALDATPSNGTNRSNNGQGGESRSIDKARDRALTTEDAHQPKEDRQENVQGYSRPSRQQLPMSDCLASPPRISPARDDGIPALSSRWSSPSARRLNDMTPLGLSTPGDGNRKSKAKVWHSVSVSRRANEGERKSGQSPPAITLVAGETSERFTTQPPVALGFELPRDQSSPSGRDRAIAATTIEEAIRSAYEPVLVSMSPARQRRQNAALCSQDWRQFHHEEPMTDGEEITDRGGYSSSGGLSTRRRGLGGVSVRGSGSGSNGQCDVIRSGCRGREPFSVTRHFQQVGLRWPSPPESMGGTAQYDTYGGCSASLGRTRGTRQHRHRMGRSRGSIGRRGGHSWSPPRTTTGTGPFSDDPAATAAGSSSSSKLFGLESREDEQAGRSHIYTGDGEYDHHGQRTTSRLSGGNSRHGAVGYHHRPLSPLMLPLDPYRGSRTVVRAGTVVSGRDAAATEHSSRRAAFRLRRASEARATTEGRGRTLALSREHDQPSQQQWRRWRRQSRGSNRSLSGDRNDGWTTSGTLLDVEEDERWRDRIRRCLPSVKDMGRELEAIRRADEAMREEQLAQVQLNTNALPLALLLVHPGGAARVRGFVARALELWQREKSRARLTHALARWKIECEAQRFRERGLGYRTRFGALKIKQLVIKRRPITLRARLATWRSFCRMEIYTTRAASARRIQTQYRRWKAFRSFLSMHYSKPLGGALSDIYLEDEREGLQFKIDASVRKDRRSFWKASIAIQTRWRMLPKRAFYRLLKQEVKRVQTHFRMWSDRRVYLFFKRQTIVAQSFARLAIWRPKWCRFRVIPPVIQRFVRGHLARQKARRMREARYRALEVTMWKVVPFQTAWRGFAARRELARLQKEKDKEWHAAVLLQRAWYRRMEQFPAFVLVSCLRMKDKSEEEQARAARLFDLSMNARLLQRTYRRRYRARIRRAAVLIQSWWRIHTGTDFVARLRAERWASRKLRCWLTACMRKRNHASWVIALCWLRSCPGRLLKHLQDFRQREEEEWWKTWREGRAIAASRLQAAVRGQRVRRQLRAEGVSQEVRRQAQIRASAGDKLRACGRGLVTRMILKHAAERIRVDILMAIRLQRAWRHRRGVLAAKRQALQEHRRMKSPFEHVGDRVEAVAQASIAAASVHLNPRNGPAGCGLWRLCRRLGCEGDVFPLLRSAGISGSEALRGRSDGDLQKLGITDAALARQRQGGKGGGGGEGVFEADKLRALLIALVCTADPVQPAPSERGRKALFEDFDYLEGYPHRQTMIRRVFLECFGAAMTQRAGNFSAVVSDGGAGERAEVTAHQLRRYFGLCGTPSIAKVRLPSLINPPPEEHQRALADDRRRLKSSLCMLSAGAERVRCLYRVPPAEVRAGGGPATALLEALRSLPEQADDEEQRQRARQAARGDTFEVMDEHRRAMLAVATSLYDLLQHLAELGPPARTVQRAYRSHTGRSMLALSRHQLALKRHSDRYMWERGTNHVKAEWERARKLEAEEKQRQYEEWLRQEERRRVEEELYRWGVLRYGWREEDLEGVPGVKSETRCVRGRSQGAGHGRCFARSEKERLERLEWERAERIADQHLTVRLPLVTVSAKRYFHATTDQLNDDPYIEGEFEPPSDDHLDLWVGFLVDARPPARPSKRATGRDRKGKNNRPSTTVAANASSGGGGSSRSSQQYSASRGGSRGKWLGPGEGWKRGEVIVVNPSEVVSAEGVKKYPKGTFGIRYLDTGLEIPDVPRDCIRVLTLTPGMKVEARYGGGLDFYPGTIDGINSRNGYALSYSIKYDDGDIEKVVKRGHIAPFPEEVAALDAVTAEATRKAAVRRDRAKFLQRRRAVVASAWRERVQKAEEDYLAAASSAPSQHSQPKATAGGGRRDHRSAAVAKAVPTRRGGGTSAKRGGAGGRGGRGRGAGSARRKSGDGADVDAVACIGMIEAAARLAAENRPRVAVALKIDYTRQATRFGCSQVQTASGALWKSTVTGTYTRGRPRYTFEEVGAVRKIQAAWAGLKGRRAFREKLAKQSIRGLGIACINEASSHAWIGHEEEGLTVEMWLLRAGVPPPDARKVAAGATKVLAQHAASRGGGGVRAGGAVGKGGGNRRTQSSSISCTSFRNWLGGGGKNTTAAAVAASAASGRAGGGAGSAGGGGAAGDAKLLKLGLESTTDRRRVMAVVMREEETPSFINWFEGIEDHRTVASAIAGGEDQAFKLIWKAFPGNQSRAENMAKRIATSNNPVTRMQVMAWLKRHDGRPGVAQSSISEQIVDVPVTSSREAEAAAYEGLWNVIARAAEKADGIIATHAGAAFAESNRGDNADKGAPSSKIGSSSPSSTKQSRKLANSRGGAVPAAATAAATTGKKDEVLQALRGKTVDGGEAKEDAASSTWAHARAALVLRTEAVSIALRWVAGAKTIQVTFRAFRCRRSYRALLVRRGRAATILQSVERRKRACITAADLREQRASRWEQLLDDETGRLYFYFKDTGESFWEPPGVPFRPMIRDRMSGALVQAWPQLERELLEERHADAPELVNHTFTPVETAGIGVLLCSLCDLPASRRCRGLELPDRALIVAARMLHNARLSTLLVGAAAAGQSQPLTLSDIAINSISAVSKASTLNKPGTAAASANTALVKTTHGVGEGSAQRHRRKPGDPPVSRKEFERVLAVCNLPYSLTWADAAYELCMGEVMTKGEMEAAASNAATMAAMGSYGSIGKGKAKSNKKKIERTREQFWAAFGAALVEAREDCDDLLCGECWESVHKRGVRACHRWEGFRAGSPACVACSRSPAERKCNTCNDLLCLACFNESHARGKKKRHSWQLCLEEPRELSRCHECRRRVGDQRCGDCDADLCDSCQAFRHTENCSHAEEDGHNTGKLAVTRGHSSGGIGCGGKPSEGSKRQQKEADEVQGDPRMLHALDRILGLEEDDPDPSAADGAGNEQHHEGEHDTEAEAEEKEDMPLSCDVCGKTPDVECEQCGTVYCSNIWVGNPGCFIKDHERGNRRNHTKRGYTHAKDLLLRAERLAKEEKERKERESRQNKESRGKEKAEQKRRLRLAQELETGGHSPGGGAGSRHQRWSGKRRR